MHQLIAVPDVFLPYVDSPHKGAHQDCMHNVRDAIRRRHYSSKLPHTTKEGHLLLENAFRWLKDVARRGGIYPNSIDRWTPEQVVETRAPAKKKAYQEAFDSLAVDPLERRDAQVKVFVKFEKGPFAGLGVKPARLIQFRNTRFTAQLATFLAPLEHALYKCEYHGTRIFAKTLNPKQRAESIANAYSPGRKYVMLDHSSFDGHMRRELLAYEHRFYKWVFGNNIELNSMLDQQMENRCSYRGLLRWKAQGGRMSGDFNTALGNSIINALLIKAWADDHGVADGNFTLQCDGDDSWCTIDHSAVVPSVKDFAKLGLTTKLEGVGYYPEEVQFCQARPVQLADGWLMCRDFRRVASRLPYTIQHFVGAGWKRYLRGIAECEGVLSNGCPILASLAASLLKFTEGAKALVPAADRYSHQVANTIKRPIQPVTDAARASYAFAWGISVEEQLLIEAALECHQHVLLPG
jgi:hypothetical protein